MPTQFVSPGAAASQGILEVLAQNEMRKRQAMLDQMAQQKATSDQEMAQATLKMQQQAAAALEEQRQATAAATEQKSVLGLLEAGGADSTVDPSLVARARKIGMGSSLTQAPDVVTQGPQTGEDEAGVPQYQVNTTPGVVQFKGTTKQKAHVALINNPDIPESVKNYIRAREAAGDENIPYQLFEEAKTKPIVRASHDRKTLEIFKAGKWEPVSGDVPKDAQILIEPAATDGSAKPYFIPLQTAQGILSFDTRGGNIVGRVGDLKPGEAAAADINRAESVAYQLGELNRLFDPSWVGPLKGRYKTMELAMAGAEGQPHLAEFQTTTAALQNMLINLRTGAQMSEPEAQRILKEMPDMNNPPDVFVARMQKASKDYNHWLKSRSRLAFGRMTEGDVTNMVENGVPTGGAAPPVASVVPGAVTKWARDPKTGKPVKVQGP